MSPDSKADRSQGDVIQIDESHAKQTLAAFVRTHLQLPWTKAKDLCRSGRVWVNDARQSDPAYRVKIGDQLKIKANSPRQRLGVLPREALIHVDADVAVVYKEAGLLSVPYDEKDKDTLSDQTRALLRRMQKHRKGHRDPMIGVVQRLDKDTSGILVFARNMKAKRHLQAQLREHTMQRRYWALAHGAVRSKTYETDIIQDRGDGLRGSWGTRPNQRGAPPSDAKTCITRVKLKASYKVASWVECQLETGRQHQIRIHLSEAGHPLVGEKVYIRDYEAPLLRAPRQMLHARSLGFVHPRSGETLHFEHPLPQDFETVLNRLRKRGKRTKADGKKAKKE